MCDLKKLVREHFIFNSLKINESDYITHTKVVCVLSTYIKILPNQTGLDIDIVVSLFMKKNSRKYFQMYPK